MRVTELIKQLKKLPKKTDVQVLGFFQHPGDQMGWEVYHSSKIHFEHEDYDYILKMEGRLYE